jgi:hypothetical protein
MVIGSTVSEHKNIRKITRRSPDRQYFNQTDHILIDSRPILNLMDIRILEEMISTLITSWLFREYDCRISNIKKMKRVKVARYGSGKLKIPEVAGSIKNKLEENLRGLTFEPRDSINDKWANISQGTHEVASEMLRNIYVCRTP